MKAHLLLMLGMLGAVPFLNAQTIDASDFEILPFGENGQIKMVYDSRQRPQCVYINGVVHLVYNGEAEVDAGGKAKSKIMSKAMAIDFNVSSRTFSRAVTLSTESSGDHHDGPVIWVDMQEKLHVFHGWHNDLGKHLISNEPLGIGTSLDDWSAAPVPAPKMAYPWMSRIYDDKQLVFYRTDGHYSSWTYRITGDNGMTWEGPDHDVTDLDINGGMDTDWSIYTSKAVSKDGNFLHVGFIAYDDYKRPRSPDEIASGKLDRSRQYNPLYKDRASYDYNLYYVKIDLRTHAVMNHQGEILKTPIDLETANSKCMIWDTEWRGGSIVPSMFVNENDQVGFLHNISDYESPESLDYHYVRFENGKWKQTRITDSNHEWNSGHLAKSADGTLHAYLITGEGYFEGEGNMDRYGGGNIEEWTSIDQGNTWKKASDLTPDKTKYPGWKFNNIQPVKKPDGSTLDGMLIFYGWNDQDASDAKAFLLVDRTVKGTVQ